MGALMAGVSTSIHVRACFREDDAVQRFACLVLRRCPGACEDEIERVWVGLIEKLGADVVRFAVGLLACQDSGLSSTVPTSWATDLVGVYGGLSWLGCIAAARQTKENTVGASFGKETSHRRKRICDG
jgi:hypothetical protein